MDTLDPSWEKFFPITDAQNIREFARTIGDYNPIHHDDKAAQAAGMRGIIAPGVMVIGFISSAIADKIPGVMVRHVEMKFSTPLPAGSTPSVHCLVTSQKKRYANVDIVVKNGEEIMAKGSCSLLLPH